MAILNFSDVLKKVGLDPKEVKLIRHALSDKRFRISLNTFNAIDFSHMNTQKGSFREPFGSPDFCPHPPLAKLKGLPPAIHRQQALSVA